MGTRGANRDAMVALLGDDTWVDALISEAYADTWAGRTSAHQIRAVRGWQDSSEGLWGRD